MHDSFRLACQAPLITLIPSTSTLSSPIQFRRSQDFYISSMIQINCNQSLAMNMQWSVINCSSSICTNTVSLGSSIATTFNELYVPARTLPFGIYQLRFTVAMMAVPSLSSSMSAFVRITPSGITANLVLLGTSMITSGHEKDLQLNPGLFSVDLDGFSFNASVG